METLELLIKTITLRPYVFVFLAVFLFISSHMIGWQRTRYFMAITWMVALICELSSTRFGIPFGWYFYTGSTVGQELYIADVPFMDSLSFVFLLFASYCMALAFLLPSTPIQPGQKIIRMYFPLDVRTGWPVVVLTTLFLTFVDVIIDPVALLGDRWFLGKIYFYPDPGIHFGIPLANYLGWATVSLLALMAYLPLDRKLTQKSIPSSGTVTGYVLLGCGLYYGVLIFNLGVTFWIEEPLQGMTGIMIYIPITILLILRLLGRLPAPTQELQK